MGMGDAEAKRDTKKIIVYQQRNSQSTEREDVLQANTKVMMILDCISDTVMSSFKDRVRVYKDSWRESKEWRGFAVNSQEEDKTGKVRTLRNASNE